MTKTILKLSLLSLLAVAVVGLPGRVQAQDSQKPHTEKKETREGRATVPPLHGKLKAVNETAKTITVGEHTIQITSGTKISKAGKPATLNEGIVGEEVTVTYQKSEGGKLNATAVRFGAKEGKAETKAGAAKK